MGSARSGSSLNKSVLPNGIRVVSEKIPTVRSVSLGVWLETGSRYETASEQGISHLIEHMVFKGTRKRSAKEIALSLESVGGLLNAFTSREYTCYSARVLDEYLDLAIDVLADMTCGARFTPTNLKREKLVILEEIKEAYDHPSDRIHDIFAQTFWDGHPLGQPILGTAESVTSFPRSLVIDYIKRYYRTGSVIVAAAGNLSHRKLVRLVKNLFTLPEGNGLKAEPARRGAVPNVTIVPADNVQTHVCLGFSAPLYAYPRKMAALAMNMYLGGGMSSVLFQKIREEKGLVYTVGTYQDYYRDSGIFGVYLSTDQTNIAQAVDITLKELARMQKRKLPGDKLTMLKDQLKGHMSLGMESTNARMSRLAKHEMYLGEYKSFDASLKEIDAITASALLEYANQFFDRSSLALATLGPVDRTALERVL